MAWRRRKCAWGITPAPISDRSGISSNEQLSGAKPLNLAGMLTLEHLAKTRNLLRIHPLEGYKLAVRPTSSQFLRRLCAVLVLSALVVASLLLPPQLEQLRSGHWAVEHFLAYFAAVPIICLAWPRPFLVAAALVPSAALLEVLQCLSPGHNPNFFAALSSMGGALSGALLATLLLRIRAYQIDKSDHSADVK
jgi:hypothetical protein